MSQIASCPIDERSPSVSPMIHVERDFIFVGAFVEYCDNEVINGSLVSGGGFGIYSCPNHFTIYSKCFAHRKQDCSH